MDRLQSVSNPPAPDPSAGETFPDNAGISPFPTEGAAGREPGTGRFATGNPGRPKGARNKVTLAREFLESESETLVAHVLASALSGDAVAQRACFTRLLPPRRDLPVEFEVPPIVTAFDALRTMGIVTAMVGEGRLTPSEGQKVASIIDIHRRAIETAELERRLLILEANVKDPPKW